MRVPENLLYITRLQTIGKAYPLTNIIKNTKTGNWHYDILKTCRE